jgi:hypothetical protein
MMVAETIANESPAILRNEKDFSFHNFRSESFSNVKIIFVFVISRNVHNCAKAAGTRTSPEKAASHISHCPVSIALVRFYRLTTPGHGRVSSRVSTGSCYNK